MHRTSFVLATGAMFLVPRGNTYYIENISQRPSKLFFAQARKVSADDEPPQEIVRAPPPGASNSAGRTTSVDPSGARAGSGKRRTSRRITSRVTRTRRAPSGGRKSLVSMRTSLVHSRRKMIGRRGCCKVGWPSCSVYLPTLTRL